MGLAQALVGDPEILILDEPTAGLDPHQIVEIRGLIQGFHGRRTVLLSSHILTEVSATCERVLILDEGRLVAHAQRLNHKAATKRVGFLLETYDLGHPDTLAALQTLTNRRYAPLDPTLPDEGPYRARWRLRVNLDPEELRAIVWT